MKGLVYFILIMVVLAGIASAFWWVIDGTTPDVQIEYLKDIFSESTEGNAASNTAESASKLGRVLKDNFNEAQQVYEHGAEAKYE